MPVNRRRFLLGGAATIAALSGPAWSQALTGQSGNVALAAGSALTRPAAPVPPPPAGTFAQVFSFTNPATQPTQVSPYFSLGIPMAKGEYTPVNSRLALYDVTGVTKIAELQTDQVAAGWTDGSVNFCVASGYLTGTTLAAGATANFMIRAISGVQSATQVVTLASLTASSDLKAVCMIGTDTYTVSFNTIVSRYSGAPGLNPQGFVKQWKGGFVNGEWCGGQYLQRDSDGAFHRWLFLKIYVTALSPSGPFVIRGLVENAQTYGANPSGTIGRTTAQLAGLNAVDSLNFFNGSSFIGSSAGPRDTRSGSFAPASVNVATASIATQMGGVALSTDYRYFPIGFTTTGTLPAGLLPASQATYWAVNAGGTNNLIPATTRFWAAKLLSVLSGVTLTSGKVVNTTMSTIANGAFYACTTGGTSDGLPPSGAVYTDTHGVVWTRISGPLGDQGTGVHTVSPKLNTAQFSKAPAMGQDTYPFWSGAGSLPKLLVGYPFTYLTRQTKTVPPFDPAIKPVAWVGAIPSFFAGASYFPGGGSLTDIGTTGENAIDERVNPFSPTAAASIYLPQDAGHAISIRATALCFADRLYYMRDERAQQVIVANYGPDRLGGNYPGMAATNSGLHLYGFNGGSPAGIGISGGTGPDWPGYAGDFAGGVSSAESSHTPCPFYWPYISSGDPLFLDIMLEQSIGQMVSTGTGQTTRSFLLGGLNYTPAFTIGQTPRGAGWQFKTSAQCEWIMPDNHVARQYFRDRMDDTANQLLNYCRATYTATAQANGYVEFSYQQFIVGPNQNAQDQETWMHGYLVMMMAWEAWKGNRPGFATFLGTYFNLMWLVNWDSDFAGTEKAIGAQYIYIGNSVNTIPPADADFDGVNTPQKRLAGPGANVNGPSPYSVTYPPPSNFFIDGISTQNTQHTSPNPSQIPAYVYWTVNLPSNSYTISNRAALVFASLAGLTQYTKVLNRVEALIASSGVPLQTFYNDSPVHSAGNQNGLMYAIKAF